MIHLFGPAYSWLAVVLVAPLIWVFGEIVPKSIFQERSDTMAPRAIFVLRVCSYLFYPILIVFSFLARLLARVLGDKNPGGNPFTLREEIKTMMQATTSIPSFFLTFGLTSMRIEIAAKMSDVHMKGT